VRPRSELVFGVDWEASAALIRDQSQSDSTIHHSTINNQFIYLEIILRRLTKSIWDILFLFKVV